MIGWLIKNYRAYVNGMEIQVQGIKERKNVKFSNMK